MPLTGGLGISKEAPTEATRASIWTREQRRTAKALYGEIIQPNIGVALPQYQGPRIEPLSPEQIAMLEMPAQFLPQTAQGYGDAAAAFQTAMQGGPNLVGTSQRELEKWLASQRVTDESAFQDRLEGVREEYRGPGTYWGGVRAQALSREQTRFEEQLQSREDQLRFAGRETALGREFAARESASQRALQAAGAAASLFERTLQASISGSDAIRQDIERGYQVEMQKFMESLPELNPVLQMAFNFINTPSMAVTFAREGISWAAGVGFASDPPEAGEK